MAVDAIADFLPQEESIALVKRLAFCDCGRLALDDNELTRKALSSVAAENLTALRGLVLAAIDYAHRAFGCVVLAPSSTNSPRAAERRSKPRHLPPFWTVSARRMRPSTATPGTAGSPTR
ncbi:hypothetical protein [Streptomyces griseocarneus]|uniref:hypothetical protein n=1 Tax=Streptomyces griseocarneus TaxID=51201 RepID=UPI00167E3634|nr:hypothetical protein [Streptomyces griseocarneus]MBZ6476257.1 hypothetical protein [Streptomyces griseocarneus]